MSKTQGKLFIVSAPSGAGKTSLTRAAVERLNGSGIPCAMSISYTTRTPRPGERDGVDYHFVSEERFESMVRAGDFLEHAEVYGRHYGTGRAATQALRAGGTHVLLDIDWQGGRSVRAQAHDAVSIFVLPPSLPELERRLRGRRQDDEAEVTRRMALAQAEMSHYHEYQHVIINVEFEQALLELVNLIRSGGENRTGAAPRTFIEKLLG